MEIFTRDLFKRLFTRKHSYRDQLFIEQGFEDTNNLGKIKRIAEDYWTDLGNQKLEQPAGLENVYYKLYYQIDQSRRSGRVTRFFEVFSKIAAVLVIPLLVTTVWYYRNASLLDKMTPVEMSFVAPEGVRSRFILPDGTSGWLNGGSQLIYSAGKTNNREVKLSGEAFFDVEKDSKHPFIVNAQLFNVTVTGTRFNVCAYPEEEWADLVLESGRVVIDGKGKKEKYNVAPGQRFAMSKKNGNHSLSEVEVSEYLEWMDGKLYFRNDPMDLVVRKLERFYRVDIEISDKSIANFRFRAMLENETLDEVLRFMEMSLGIKATVIPRTEHADGTFSKQKIILKTQ